MKIAQFTGDRMNKLPYFPAPDGYNYMLFVGNNDEWLASCSEEGRAVCFMKGARVITNGLGYFEPNILGKIINIIPLYQFLSGEYPVRPAIVVRRYDNNELLYTDLHELDLA